MALNSSVVVSFNAFISFASSPAIAFRADDHLVSNILPTLHKSRPMLFPAHSIPHLTRAVPYLPTFWITLFITGQATAPTVPPIAPHRATSHIVASLPLSRTGCAAPNQAPTRAPHLRADIDCTAFPSGATANAASGK